MQARRVALACAAAAVAALPGAAALERPDHEVFAASRQNRSLSSGWAEGEQPPGPKRHDKCMKEIWPDIVDTCGGPVTYFGSCSARAGGKQGAGSFAATYGTCEKYCGSFGFHCTGGRAAPAGSSGCPQDAPWVQCSEPIDANEAVCNCHDPLDTFLWQDAKKLCGSGKALVGEIAKYSGSCTDYCENLGLQCSSAGAAVQGCDVAQKVACNVTMPLAQRGAVCECAGTYDRSGAHAWPDQKELCAASTVLLDGKVLEAKYSGSCATYCRSLGGRVPGYNMHFFCYGSWQSSDGTCDEYQKWSKAVSENAGVGSHASQCAQDHHGEDAVCSCSFLDRL